MTYIPPEKIWELTRQKLETETDYKIKPYDDDLNGKIDLAVMPFTSEAELYEFYDDFGDNKLSERVKELVMVGSKVVFARVFRPEWTTVSGSPSVSSGWLYLDGDPEEVKTSSDIMEGSWEAKWAIDAVTEADPVINHMVFILKDSDNYYEVYYYMKSVADYSEANLKKVVGGSATALINLPKITSAGTYVTKMTRYAGNFEVFLNGVSQGTCSDTDVSPCNEIHLKGEGAYNPTGKLRFDYLYVR